MNLKFTFFQQNKTQTSFPCGEPMSTVNAINCMQKLHDNQDNVAIDVLGEHLHHAFEEVCIDTYVFAANKIYEQIELPAKFRILR